MSSDLKKTIYTQDAIKLVDIPPPGQLFLLRNTVYASHWGRTSDTFSRFRIRIKQNEVVMFLRVCSRQIKFGENSYLESGFEVLHGNKTVVVGARINITELGSVHFEYYFTRPWTTGGLVWTGS